METILVTGGAGFIGCNFVRLALAETGARVVVLDKLTYAGSLENLADVARPIPRFEFVAGGHRRPRRACAGCSPSKRPTAVRQLRRREPRRPLDRRRQRLHPDQHRRRLRDAGGGAPRISRRASAEAGAARLPLPPRLHRRGLRQPRGRPARSPRPPPTPPTPPTPPPRPRRTTWCAPTTRPTACRP